VVAVVAERAERLYRFNPLDESGVFPGLGLIHAYSSAAGSSQESGS